MATPPIAASYSANTFGVDALRWAVRDQHCTVVSQSFHRRVEATGSGLQSDDLLKDWLALRWPYPTIVQAAGNFWAGDDDNVTPPADEFVNHKGYNSLAVGNHDDTAGSMSADSVFRNPTSTHGDRELPELAANGTAVSAVGENMSGTSFAAPAAAGVTALLQDVDGVLRSWPEGCRAILLASAGRNVRGGTWWSDVTARVDGRDGAGAVDAGAGVAIARQRRGRGTAGSRRGWDVGTLSSSVVGNDRLATFRHRVTVPTSLLVPQVKVALAWDSAVTSVGRHRHRVHPHRRPRPARAGQPGPSGRIGGLVGQQLRSRRVLRRGRRDLRDRDPPVVGHRQRLVRGRLERHRHPVALPVRRRLEERAAGCRAAPPRAGASDRVPAVPAVERAGCPTRGEARIEGLDRRAGERAGAQPGIEHDLRPADADGRSVPHHAAHHLPGPVGGWSAVIANSASPGVPMLSNHSPPDMSAVQ